MEAPTLRFFVSPEAKSAGASFSAPRPGDAGFDLRAAESLALDPGTQALIPTGLKISVPVGWVGIVKDRSSMAMKQLRTHAGVIDAAYRGEVKVVMSNAGPEPYFIEKGAKIAQLVVVPHLGSAIEVQVESDLGGTERGSGGFGSTGAK